MLSLKECVYFATYFLLWEEIYVFKNVLADTKCIEEIGCFTNERPFFHILYRPVSLLPWNRNRIGTTFRLYTRRNPHHYILIEPQNLDELYKSTFNAEIGTKFVIHGFLGTPNEPWVKEVKDSLLHHGDYNIFIVDWKNGSKIPYSQAVANARVVGGEIAKFISYIRSIWGEKFMKKLHVIGASLGAHVASYAGKRIGNIPRLTGLDPAAPYFQNMPAEVRLDKSDAKFVDVIHTHTSALGPGISNTIGHVDFYPNNGLDQPGCRLSTSNVLKSRTIDEVFDHLSCSHQRATLYFAASYNQSACRFIGYTCKDWNTFLKGKCSSCGIDGSRCALMGVYSDSYRYLFSRNETKKFYMKTSSDPPYCLFHYQVRININNVRGSSSQSGKLFLTLIQNSYHLATPLSKKEENFKPGKVYTYLLTTKKQIENIEKIFLLWTHFSIFQTPRLYIDTIEIVPMIGLDDRNRENRKITLCKINNSGPLTPGKEKLFIPKCN